MSVSNTTHKLDFNFKENFSKWKLLGVTPTPDIHLRTPSTIGGEFAIEPRRIGDAVAGIARQARAGGVGTHALRVVRGADAVLRHDDRHAFGDLGGAADARLERFGPHLPQRLHHAARQGLQRRRTAVHALMTRRGLAGWFPRSGRAR